MRMVRRSRLEIYVDVLEAVARGVRKPTRIMYKANLSWGSMKGFFGSLLERGLIRESEVGGRREYEITDKGLRVLDYFRKAREMLPVEIKV